MGLRTSKTAHDIWVGRLICLALMALLVPAAAFAEGGDRSCETEAFFSALSESSDHLVDDRAYTVDSSLLFYQFTHDLEIGADRVEFEFQRQTERLATEAVALIEADPALARFQPKLTYASGTVLGVLASEPQQRAALHRLADSGASVDVIVRLNGEAFDLLTFDELVSRSAELRQDLPLPHSNSSQLVFPQAVSGFESAPSFIPTKGSCENTCLGHRNACFSSCNGLPPGPYTHCRNECTAAYNHCLSGCGQSGCTPSTSTSTSMTLVSQSFLSYAQCLVTAPWRNDYYRFVRRTYQVTTTTTTTHADCTQTVSTSTSYATVDCWIFHQNGPCSNPITTSNLCT